MTIDAFLEEPGGAAVEGAAGQETDWMGLGDLKIESGQVWIGDLAYFGSDEDGFVGELQPGSYVVELRGVSYGWDKRVAAIRLQSEPGEVAETVGTTFSDRANVCIADLSWGRRAEKELDESVDLVDLIEDNEAGLLDLFEDESAVAPFVSSGFGDGEFPVQEIVNDGRRVGLLVTFIESGSPYPFETQEVPEEDEDEDE